MSYEVKTPTLQGCANLFAVAKRLLQARAEAAGVTKIRDNDVGQHLSLDPSDTSNWKNGKKAISRFSQYMRLASATGASIEALYAVATEALQPDEVLAVQAPLDMLVPEVTPIGSILLFFFIKERLSNHAGAKAHDGNVGSILGFVPTETTRWKRGSRTVGKIDQFFKLAHYADASPLYLYEIASGTNVPEILKKYTFRAEKSARSRKPAKRRPVKLEASA